MRIVTGRGKARRVSYEPCGKIVKEAPECVVEAFIADVCTRLRISK